LCTLHVKGKSLAKAKKSYKIHNMSKIKDYLETLNGVKLPIFLPVAYFIEHTHSADEDEHRIGG
jgi:hypothetical protein